MKLAVANLEVDVRPGTVDDVPLLLSFIRSMAAFEKLEVHATEETLRESLFGDRPAARTLLAFVDGEPVAYAVYFFSFATMVGKRGLWLDDLYVIPDFREKGIAKALMAYLADLAIQNDCGRFEWMVLDWNQTAIDFYQKMGATVLDDWRVCRLEDGELAAVAKQHVPVDVDDGKSRKD
jgi:GNAT superfamily N-acetyltransferase